MRNVSVGLKGGEGDERRTLCPPATRLIWLEGMSSAARMEEDIVIEEGWLGWLVWMVELSREVLVRSLRFGGAPYIPVGTYEAQSNAGLNKRRRASDRQQHVRVAVIVCLHRCDVRRDIWYTIEAGFV